MELRSISARNHQLIIHLNVFILLDTNLSERTYYLDSGAFTAGLATSGLDFLTRKRGSGFTAGAA